VHRGVYVVGHRILTTDGRWMAAILAAGWRTVRITWQQLQADAQALAEDLRAVLGRPSL
jgi:hypothetical protein